LLEDVLARCAPGGAAGDDRFEAPQALPGLVVDLVSRGERSPKRLEGRLRLGEAVFELGALAVLLAPVAGELGAELGELARLGVRAAVEAVDDGQRGDAAAGYEHQQQRE